MQNIVRVNNWIDITRMLLTGVQLVSYYWEKWEAKSNDRTKSRK